MQKESDSPRVELLVRDLAPGAAFGRQRAVCSRLRDLEAAGTIAAVTVDVWGKQVPADVEASGATGADLDRSPRAKYEEFLEWATRHGHDLEPAFDRRTFAFQTGETRSEVFVFPIMCLAVYDAADELLAVAPCSTDEGVWTVEDCLTALETETWDPVVGDPAHEQTAPG